METAGVAESGQPAGLRWEEVVVSNAEGFEAVEVGRDDDDGTAGRLKEAVDLR